MTNIFASCIAAFSCGLTIGQEVTVINHFGDTVGVSGDVPFTLRDVRTKTLVVNYYEPATSDQSGNAEQMLMAALTFYVERMITHHDDRAVLSKPVRKVITDLNAIVTEGLKYYGLKGTDRFPGFSGRVEARLDQTVNTGLANTAYYSEHASINENNQLASAMIAAERNEIRTMVAIELKHYTRAHLQVLNNTTVSTTSDAVTNAVLREVNSFRKNDPLEPIHFDFGTETATLLASEDEFIIPGMQEVPSEAGFEERVLALLEMSNDRMDYIQEEISELRTGKTESVNERPEMTDLRGQISQMKADIEMLKSRREGNLPEPTTTGIMEGLPEHVEIHFAISSIVLDLNSSLILSEIIDILARRPQMRLLVSGHADQSGSAEANLVISRQRAEIVKKYMTQNGISPERIILNFFGAAESQPGIHNGRKAVIEFLQ